MAKVVDDQVILNKNDVKKIKKEILRTVKTYANALRVMACDMPIETLCLPKELNNILIKANILRVYDILDIDLAEIKGIGVIRADMITARMFELGLVS